MIDLAAAALAELTQRRQQARRAVAQGQLSGQDARAALLRWCAIATWFGADLPDDLQVELIPIWPDQPASSAPPLFTHYCPPRTRAADWLTAMAQQLRRDAEAQLARAEQDPARQPRARARTALDRTLSLAAGLPPIGADQPERIAA